MYVRITKLSEADRTVLKIAGRLESEFLAELDAEVRSIDGPDVLDLSELLSADEISLEWIRRHARSGTQVRGASRYVQLLLGQTVRGESP